MQSSRRRKKNANSASPPNRIRSRTRFNKSKGANSASFGKSKRFHNIKSLVHETGIGGLLGILGNDGMQIQVTRQKNNIHVVGQGDPTRALTVASYSTLDEDFWKKYGDAHGIFFRVDFNAKSPNVGYDYCSRPEGDVAFVFSPQILNETKSWILNSTENNGFYLGTVPGLVGESAWSGYLGITYNNKNIQNFPERKPGMDPIRGDDTELLIFKNINLKHLTKIIFKSQRILDTHKDQVNELLKVNNLGHVKLSSCS
jgi:hypothetical protein